MLAIEPRGHNGGDEELGAVATRNQSGFNHPYIQMANSRVGTSVGHGEDTRLGVLQLEVLIGELLTVDGTATGTL